MKDERRRGPRIAVAGLLLTLVIPPALEARSRDLRFRHISIEQGLSQATVSCFLQDRVGFLWIGTQDGLNRFDGYSFVVYNNDPADSSTLSNNWIQALLEDASGDIWVGTRGGGLSRWLRSSGRFVSYRHDPADPESLADDQVRALYQDTDGILWVGTEQSGLDRFDPQRGTFEHYRHHPRNPASLPDDQVRALYQDRDGRLWIGTFGGLACLERPAAGGGDGRFTRYRHDPRSPGSLSDDNVRSILEDRAGNLWVGTFDGLNRLRAGATGHRPPPEAAAFERFRHAPHDPGSLSDNRTRALFEDRDGRLWIGTDGGLNLYDPVAGTFEHYRHRPANAASLSNDRVFAVYQDRGGVLWVGTQGGGINNWDPRTWSFSSATVRLSELSGGDVLAFAEDGDGRLWIGTSGHGLNRVDRETGDVRHYRHAPDDPASLGDDRVTALLFDRVGTLWAGTLAGGLNRFDPATETFERFVHDPADPASLGADIVAAILEDRAGRLWLGTIGGGLNRFDRATETVERLVYRPADAASLSDDRVTSLAEDGEGRLWLGTLGSGLNRFDPGSPDRGSAHRGPAHRAGGTFRRFASDPDDPVSLSNDIVLAVHTAPGGVVWAGTQVGLNRLDRIDEVTGEAVFRRFFVEDGLPNDFIYGIESEAGGALWLSTNRGLSRFDPGSETFKNYDSSHGLHSNEFNMGAHYRAASGELFFGGIDGFNAFHPGRIELNTQPPPVVLTSFSKLNRAVTLAEPIFDRGRVALGHRDSIVSFEFAALDFTAPERNRYRYKLEGFEEEWIDLGSRRRVSFTNLDPGRYVLRVLGSNNDGVWNETGAAIALTVSPPPWRSWWAYSLYVLALLGTIGGFVRSQQRKVERERAVNRRLREVDQLKGELLANLKAVVQERTAQVEEREQLLAERGRLITELEAKNAELERFNYTVSHDLKTPLVTIKGFLGLLEQDAAAGDDARMKHDIGRIGSAADKMHRLLEELLQLSRLGHQTGEPEEVSMDALVGDALELNHGLIEERRVVVEVERPLPVVMGDRVRLLEVFHNLLANAVKYMGDQQQPRVVIGAQRNGSPTAVYFVRDNGMGIDRRYHRKIFGLFERLENGEKGTGIGLALVKRIVELHRGRIWVESEGPGHGSTFRFTLEGLPGDDEAPLAPQEPPPGGEASWPIPPSQEPLLCATGS